jgi:subtilisin family serine protease
MSSKPVKFVGNPSFAFSRARALARAAPRIGADKLIVRFKEDALRPAAAAVSRGGTLKAAALKRALPEALGASLDQLARSAGLRDIEPLFAPRSRAVMAAASALKRRTQSLARSVTQAPMEELRGVTVCRIDPKTLTEKKLKSLRETPGIASVERMPVRWLAATPGSAAPADPLRNAQWGLRAIGWFDATIPDATSVEVAVLDTGIDLTHPDIAGQVADYDRGGQGPRDVLGHGTHVAGIIAATANNDVGMTGVANCRLDVWKIFRDEPESDGGFYVDSEAYLRALGAIAGNDRVRVVNLSIGGGESSRLEQELFDLLASNGKVAVAAMGNEYEEGNPVEYPAAYRNVVAVGAVDIALRRASFSNTGRHITVCAPGQDILSTLPMKASPYMEDSESEYAHWDGTSMATPFVSGALALLCARFPGITVEEIVARLEKSARTVPAMKKKPFTQAFGHGLLDLATLLE